MSPNSKRLSRLAQAYAGEHFRKLGHQLIDFLADGIDKANSSSLKKVIPYRTPADELAFWQQDLQKPGDPMQFFERLMAHSIQLRHPRYIGHQIAVPALVAALSGLFADVMNNGTGVYEMGMAANALEKIISDWLGEKIGFPKTCSGFLTSGGTLANLTAMLAARKLNAPGEVWEKGHSEKLAIMVSEEAHYCIDRAVRIMGLGSNGIIKVPVNDRFEIRPELLDQYKAEAESQGYTVFALVGCAGSTATGSYDDLNALADFCEKHQLWFHVDGAHGGAVIFSDQYCHLTQGISRAESVVIDFHKMMMSPALNTALMFRKGMDAYKTFEQRAQYLWDADREPEWYHSGKRTFECTKLMMSIKIYAILRTYGEEIFAENVDCLFQMAQTYADIIRKDPDFELALDPPANIVNFRYHGVDSTNLDDLNGSIRQQLIEAGKFYIVQTHIQGRRYLRMTVMNPFSTPDDLRALLAEIKQIAQKCK